MNREAFEKIYADAHDLPLETFSQYRMGDTYRLPGIASHWRTWQMALECAQSDQFKIAYQEFIDKTEWVQKTAKPAELGKHRADILKSRIDSATAENEALRKDADLYQQVQIAAGSLPDGWEILLRIENGFGGIDLIDPYGTTVDLDNVDESLGESVASAVSFAASKA